MSPRQVRTKLSNCGRSKDEEFEVPKSYVLVGDVTADKMALEEREARGAIADRIDFRRLDDLRPFAMQIRDGIEGREGTNPRLAALLQHPEMQTIPMRRIGVVTLESLRDRLCAELAAPVDTGPGRVRSATSRSSPSVATTAGC